MPSAKTKHQKKSPARGIEQRKKSYPKPPLPRQHQESPGLESKVRPRPKFEAPAYKAAGKLEGKVALITGGDSGIGRAVAVMYAREGADVAIVYLPDEQSDAEETRDAINSYGRRALLIPGDVGSSEFCRGAVDETIAELGALDILVNNAAFQKNQESIDDVTDEQMEYTFRTNFFGYFYMAKAALARMKRGATIINTGSITGLEGESTLLDYASTKGAVHAFTKSLAQNLVEKGIRVNCVAPGPVWTPLNTAAKPAEEVTKFGQDTPMGRPGQPEEIAPTYVFLASEADSSFITGEVITLLGGNTTAA
ncbi:MAG TPA: SDR family oxidoreductase [Gemmatimonadaceae bacterium]|jgi:NAD(P)-dependent dehydrogenase (short-subunit alcohol dehydrogenase family)|nr:SDR family oxidoreductase [Gemmatimonadaceae bacterium]